jgi:hypothetical protein
MSRPSGGLPGRRVGPNNESCDSLVGIMIGLSFVAGVVCYWAEGLTTSLVLIIVGIDLLFVGLFLWVLYRTCQFGWV